MARKIHMKNPGPDGSKAPKKSLKLLDPLHNLTVDTKHTKAKNQSNGDQTSKNYKKNSSTEEVACQVSSIRNNGPGIVARLMGITDLPLGTQTTGKHKLNQTKKQNEGSSVGNASHDPIFVRRHERQKSSRLKPSKHPQQEELQNSKKDFSGYRDPSRVADVDSIQRYFHGSNEKSVKVDITTHVNSGRAGINKSTKSTYSHHPERKENKPMIIPKESMTSRNIHPCDSSEPTRIVILKPGPDQSGSETDDHPSSSASSAGRYNNIDDFLEEVRDGVKNGLPWRKHGTVFESMNHRNRELVYGRQFDPRKIAKHIASQVRESVAMDLLWSERMRKYTELEPSQSICSYTDRGSVAGTTTDGTPLPVGDIREPVSGQFGSCRHIVSDDVICPHELSSRNLVRSLSAPVKRETFAKVLLEDNHFLNVAHHVGEATYEDAKEPKRRAKFTFREKILNFRHSFSFGGGLFGRKLQKTVSDPHTYGDSMDDIMSGPTVVRHPGDVHENFTEVPPSPVSACSSSEYDEPGGFSDDPAPSSDLSFPGYDSVSEKKELKLDDRDKQGDSRDESETVERSGQNKAHVHHFIAVSGLHGNKSDTTRKPEGGRGESEHRLPELTDEALSAIVGTSAAPQKVWGRRTSQLHDGRKLVDLVWDAVKEYIYPKKDMRMDDDEVDGVGEEVEQLIIEEMVEEMSMEMMLQLNDLSFNHFHIKAFAQLC